MRLKSRMCVVGANRVPTSGLFQQQRRNLVYNNVRLRQVPTHLHSGLPELIVLAEHGTTPVLLYCIDAYAD
jgi:hypothetical protein